MKKINSKMISSAGFLLGILSVSLFQFFVETTSSNEFCASCHIHPQATRSWKLSSHFDTQSGVAIACVDCHLPPGGLSYLSAKVTTGVRDVYGMLFIEKEKMNWEAKSGRELAAGHVYKASCIACHQNLFPRRLSQKGEEAHLYYQQKAEQLRCINCHLEVGHFHKKSVVAESESEHRKIHTTAAAVDSFANFFEKIPGSYAGFQMIAIPGGEVLLGSPPDEALRQEDEGPQKKHRVGAFWMSETEVSWELYDVYYNEMRTGKNAVDAVTGPTPPYGNPDQGWGREDRPAITMTHFAAQKFCQWLSEKTGKSYRLPTEMEWEYACRGDAGGAYFFPGVPDQLDEKDFWNRIFGVDTSQIASHIIYAANSNAKTQPPDRVRPNPFGLKNMLGNVWEFCSDPYLPDAYKRTDMTNNKRGLAQKSGHGPYVIRGGSFKSGVGDLRISNRDHTQDKKWMLTDPQFPKSKWWYSDCNDVGFRVVCEIDIE